MAMTDKRPIFIVSSPRSGSTLLRLILDAHPRLAVPPPAWLFHYIYPYLYSYGDLSVEANLRAMVEDATLRDNIIDRQDAFGGAGVEWNASDGIVQVMWNKAGDDLFGAISRGARLVDGAELLLGGEVYNYHHVMNMKPPAAPK